METKMRRLMARPVPGIVEDFSTRPGVERRHFFGSDFFYFSEDFRFYALSVSDCGPFIYAPAYSKNSGRALSVTPVRPVRPSVRTSHFRVRAITLIYPFFSLSLFLWETA